MLADEYVLIVRSLLIYSPGRTNKAEQQNITSTALTLLSFGLADESRNISAAESPCRWWQLNTDFQAWIQRKNFKYLLDAKFLI
jgi:hypothetical protein